jgi:hypothetical protein
MKTSFTFQLSRNLQRLSLSLVVATTIALSGEMARASIAYGSINNFDCVNDTGVPAHGFEIELEDLRTTDIAGCYSWNHYGTPKISESAVFISGAWHTNVFVRYAANWTNNSGWSAYTAVPAGPIPPTQGHQFTNPGTNFGGEHFGVGYRRAPSAVKYNWLIDNGAHVLVHGPPVNVATPTFTYIPPVPPAPGVPAVPAQVQAAIVPPPPPVPDPKEFGAASWVKEIRTETHNPNPVKLRDLVSDDPEDANENNWRNGEPDEVEVEWQILQVDHNSANGGANGELVGAPENLNHGDEVVTRRYEFYKYVGPIDAETGEALAQTVALNGTNGTGSYSNTVVVGAFIGSQMSAFDVDEPIGLIDHLQDGRINTAYPARTLVLSGSTNFVATDSGGLPSGMTFNRTTGVVSGTPSASGTFTFQVQVAASNNPVVTRKYLFIIAAAGAVLPPHSSVDTSASPATGGTTTGDSVYTNGTTATVTATPAAGFAFVNWTDNGELASSSASYMFTNLVNRSLVANFVAMPQLTLSTPQANTLAITWPTNFSGFALQQNSDAATTNWVAATNAVSVGGTNYQANIPTTSAASFFRLRHP